MGSGITVLLLAVCRDVGVEQAVRWLQEVVGADPTGVIRPDTVLAVQQMDAVEVIEQLSAKWLANASRGAWDLPARVDAERQFALDLEDPEYAYTSINP